LYNGVGWWAKKLFFGAGVSNKLYQNHMHCIIYGAFYWLFYKRLDERAEKMLLLELFTAQLFYLPIK